MVLAFLPPHFMTDTRYGARVLVTEEALPQAEAILGLLCQHLYILGTLASPADPAIHEIHVAFYGKQDEFAYEPGDELPLARIVTERVPLGINVRLEKVPDA